jgi:peptidyl-tRNA hydrolase
MAAQAGHAFMDAADACRKVDPGRLAEYCEDRHGTKVVLGASLPELEELYELAKDAGLPASWIVDSGHVMPPHFDGSPIVTAVGIGPARRHECHHITGRLALVR